MTDTPRATGLATPASPPPAIPLAAIQDLLDRLCQAIEEPATESFERLAARRRQALKDLVRAQAALCATAFTDESREERLLDVRRVEARLFDLGQEQARALETLELARQRVLDDFDALLRQHETALPSAQAA